MVLAQREQAATDSLALVGATAIPLTLGGIMELSNVFFMDRADGQWVLIDTGVPGSAGQIRSHAAARYGVVPPPRAIILTHGHFDHIGSVRALLRAWQVPVYAHPLELPYLTGQAILPPLDPTVGGMLANLSRLFPPSGTDISGAVYPLPADGTVPELPGWRWVHTPGHTPGHVSLFEEAHRALIAGDAVTTMDQEQPVKALTVAREIHGPPTYATSDWEAAGRSVAALADLEPLILATGHGHVMSGADVAPTLHDLAEHFGERAVPRHGRYVPTPARFDAAGRVVSLPPAPPDPLPLALGAAALTATAAGIGLAQRRRGR